MMITNFNRSRHQLEEFLIFSVLVAGKNAKVQRRKLRDLKRELGVKCSWTKALKAMTECKIKRKLVRAKVGQYGRIGSFLSHFKKLDLDLATCTVADLENVPGIGPKTARFFILHSRANQELAVLDVHILSWLRERGYDTPKQTPQGKQYARLEKAFLKECSKLGESPADLDLRVWSSRRCK